MRPSTPILLMLLPALLSGRGVRQKGRDLAPLDRIQMVSGDIEEGRVVRMDERSVTLRTGGRDRQYDREDVTDVRSTLSTLPEALRREARLDPFDYDGLLAEAEHLRTQGLPLEADLLYWRSILARSTGDAAHEALGHRQRNGRWIVPHRGRWYSLEDLYEERSDWGGAWEFSTTHFDLRSNLALEQALDGAWSLERIYQGIYELFRGEFGLYEVTEPMTVWLHADEGSYVQPGGDRRGYFSASDERVAIDASRGLIGRMLVHEVTRQILYEAGRSQGASGELPGWLEEGLAQYVETVLDVRGGVAELQPGRASGRLFATHALANKPYKLSRVLNFDEGDFFASTKMSLKFAQAYTLVHFCLHGAEGRYRKGFSDYVRSALEGKGSQTHFKKALAIKERDFEEQWRTYVAAATGRR